MENMDTINLLKECDAGSKMAVASIDEVLEKVKDKTLLEHLIKSKDHHSKLGNELHSLLIEYNSEEKDPSIMAKSMSWMKTNLKIQMNESDSTIASLITDGCNMGIKSLNQYLNEYPAANDKSKDICNRLISIEEMLCDDMKKYL